VTVNFSIGLCILHVVSVVHSRCADGGDVLQLWRVAVYILNKQLRTTDKGWPLELRVGEGLTTLQHKKISLLLNVKQGLGIGELL